MMRTILPILVASSMALLDGCQPAEERSPRVSGKTPLAQVGNARRGSEGSHGSRSRETSRSDPRGDAGGSEGVAASEDAGPSGDAGGHSRGSPGSEPTGELPDERRRDRRSRETLRLGEDELRVSLEARSHPHRMDEVDRTLRGSTGLWRTMEELEAFLERINARDGWIQVIWVGPWRIRIVRDTFFDPYRRDSGWLDIDALDGGRP